METLSQDYYKPVSEMKDKELWMSTLTEGSRPKSFGDNKICLLCGFQYYFRPSRCKEHLGVTCAPVKMVQKCKPLPQHVERYTAIVEDLPQRQLHAKTQDKQTGKRTLDQDSDCVVVGEEIGNASEMPRGSDPFKITRTREEVNMQWARSAVSAGLPMSFFDNKEVRKAVLFTTECGNNYIGTKPGGVKEPTLSHRTYFTTKLIPTLDKLIDDQNMGKMRTMAQELAAAVFSDGWTRAPC